MNERMPSSQLPPEVQEAHFRLMCLIELHPDYSQRQLAQAMGISLGKAHYLLRALFDKGLVKAGKFSQSPNKLPYLYRLTPAGVKHRMQLTQQFLRRKELEFELLRTEIDQLRAALVDGQHEKAPSDTAY
jgi:EPS-associated MarR family transcriptional regulator